MLNFLTGLQTKLIIAGGIALTILALLTRNRQLKDKADELTDYKNTKQRANRADRSAGNFNDDLNWLRERSGQYGGGAGGTKPSDGGTRKQPRDWDASGGFSEW